jgi:CRP/FNR family transcriptional regulator, cyclic AMP receptor protein
MLNLEEKASALEHTKLFRYADKSDLIILAEHLQEITFEEGEVVFSQNGTENAAYLMLSGRVNIIIDGILMAHYDQGQIFGELSMLDGSPYTATATAVSKSTCLKISSEILFSSFHQTENLAVAIVKSMTKRLKRHLLV